MDTCEREMARNWLAALKHKVGQTVLTLNSSERFGRPREDRGERSGARGYGRTKSRLIGRQFSFLCAGGRSSCFACLSYGNAEPFSPNQNDDDDDDDRQGDCKIWLPRQGELDSTPTQVQLGGVTKVRLTKQKRLEQLGEDIYICGPAI